MSQSSTTLICAFEVPPEADAEFLAGWERTPGAAVLYRALRSDVEFRFVVVGPAPVLVDASFPSHPALYEVVHEQGEVDQPGGTVLINPFDVPPDDDGFLDVWHHAREALAREHGFLGARLYQSTEPTADFRFVEIARWSSPLMFARASAKTAYPGNPALYEVVPASSK